MTQTPVTEAMSNEEEPPSPGSLSNSCIEVELIVDASVTLAADAATIERAVRAAAAHRGFFGGSIGVRVTDDSAIQILNARHLGHDYATDVISFAYAAATPEIEGELVVSIDTAKRQAAAIGWPVAHELLLYVVHGTLHIMGMDDHQDDDRAAMRAAEAIVLSELGIEQIHRFGADQFTCEDGSSWGDPS